MFSKIFIPLTDPIDNKPFLHLSLSSQFISSEILSLCILLLVHVALVSFSVDSISVGSSGKNESIFGNDLVWIGSVMLLISGVFSSTSLKNYFRKN